MGGQHRHLAQRRQGCGVHRRAQQVRGVLQIVPRMTASLLLLTAVAAWLCAEALGPALILPWAALQTLLALVWHLDMRRLDRRDDEALRSTLALLRLAWASARQGTPNRYVCETIFRHVWQGGAPADDAARLEALTAQLAPARDPASDAVKHDLRAATDAALAADVFGVPTFGVDGRVFWGFDALPLLRAQLEGDTRVDEVWACAASVAQGVRR